MAALTMEPSVNNGLYDLSNVDCTMYEQPDAGGLLPAPSIAPLGAAPLNIQRDQPLFIDFKWVQNGALSGAALGGVVEFQTKFFFEALGSTEVPASMDLGNTVPFQAGVGFNYDPTSSPLCRITVPANTIPVGVFACTAVVQANIIGLGTAFASGYVRFPYLNVYEANI